MLNKSSSLGLKTMENTKYKATIGLEIHAELKTASKMFCSCKNNPNEKKPNFNICPVCMGHPGTLPVLNKEAIKHVLKMGIAINGNIADFTEWDRKNYFYPDIPKGYQISQYKFPLITGGLLNGVNITRIHLEEDTARSIHDALDSHSLVDFNRAGVPLMELVTEPVIRSGEEASRFAKELQLLLRYLGAGEANMEKGEMRVEANVSVSDTEKFGTKTEVKNLNSFKSVEKAVAYEIERQVSVLEAGEKVIQETRGWDENKGKTFSQRKKEDSHDYRYFPDPDIPKLKISEIQEFSPELLKKEMPELPWDRRNRLINDFSIKPIDAEIFVSSPVVGDFLESVIKDLKNKIKESDKYKRLVKTSVNYLISDLLGLIRKDFGEDLESGILSKTGDKNNISPSNFSDLMIMIDDSKLSSRGAKDTLKIMYDLGGLPSSIAESNGFIQKNDPEALKKAIEAVLTSNDKVVQDYKSGKTASLQFLIGQAMKVTKGSANPDTVKNILIDLLK